MTLALQDSLHQLINWFLDPRSSVLDLEGGHRPRAIAQHIACAYRDLIERQDITATLAVQKKPPHINWPEYLSHDPEYLKPVKELGELVEEEMQTFLSHFYIQGSLATMDYSKGWSDLDSFVVVRDEAILDSKKLYDLRKLCFKAWPLLQEVTPLQHHGLIISSEYDLGSYNTAYLPPDVLNHAVSLLPNTSISFGINYAKSHSLRGLMGRQAVLNEAIETGVFKHHPHQGIYLEAHFKNKETMRQLFALLGYVMTVPAYYLDSIDKGCYKRESFDRARVDFTSKNWSIIERASEIRYLWSEKEGCQFEGNRIPDWVESILGNDYIHASKCLIDEAIDLIHSKDVIENK